MNRNEFLYRTVPTWIPWVGQVLVVDWSSDTSVFLPGISNVSIVRLDGENLFYPTRARNYGACRVTTKYLLFIDSDVEILDLSGLIFSENTFYIGGYNDLGIYTSGTCLLSKKLYDLVGGYDEKITFDSGEDGNMYDRLVTLGFVYDLFPAKSLRHIDHSNELRVRYRPYAKVESYV